MSIFNKAAEAAKTTTKTAEKKETLVLPLEYNEPLARLLQAKKDKKQNEAVIAALESDIKPVVTSLFSSRFEELKRNPGTCQVITADGKTACKVIIKDQYSSVDDETEKAIVEAYGEDVVETKTEYGFNGEILSKHMDIIARLIENCEAIPNEDKEQLITATVKKTIRKGIIDQATSYGNVGQFLSYIRPITVLQ